MEIKLIFEGRQDLFDNRFIIFLFIRLLMNIYMFDRLEKYDDGSSPMIYKNTDVSGLFISFCRFGSIEPILVYFCF